MAKNEIIQFERSEEEKMRAELEIKTQQVYVDYEVREYPLEVVISKFETDADKNKNEIFIPPYQRAYVWTTKQKCEFIESLLLGLPIPYLFTADHEGRSEIVDGSQRIRTIAKYFNNEFSLEGLDMLPSLNGFYFKDLVESRQKRLKKRTIRIIELTDKADYAIRKEIFRRINVSPTKLNPMQIRQGVYEGSFLEFIKICSENLIFKQLCPVPQDKADKGETKELILRFFAMTEAFDLYEQQVDKFLDAYIEKVKDSFDEELLAKSFNDMLNFVYKYFPYGFAKSAKAKSTPRVRFEAIAIGASFALKEKPDLKTTREDVLKWLKSRAFQDVVTTDAANNKSNVMARINFVKNKLLGIEPPKDNSSNL